MVAGIEVNRTQVQRNVDSAITTPTALNPVLGYDAVSRITKRALEDGITPREATAALGLLTAEDYDRHVDPAALTPGWLTPASDAFRKEKRRPARVPARRRSARRWPRG